VYVPVHFEPEVEMGRVMADCRRMPSDSNCSLTIIGDEEEVVQAAAQHAVTVHGHDDSPEMREQIKGFLEPEESYQAGHRDHDAAASA
jgi:predicted small metal-binding protein